VSQHCPHDFRNLRGRLTLREYYLRIALPQRSVMIHLRKIQILERQIPQLLNGAPQGNFPRGHTFQQSSQLSLVHEFTRDTSME
jgi:hypothetical protein